MLATDALPSSHHSKCFRARKVFQWIKLPVHSWFTHPTSRLPNAAGMSNTRIYLCRLILARICSVCPLELRLSNHDKLSRFHASSFCEPLDIIVENKLMTSESNNPDARTAAS